MEIWEIGNEYLDLRDVVQLRAELVEQLEYDAENNVIGPDHEDAIEALGWIDALEEDMGGNLYGYAQNESHMIRDDKFIDYAEEFADDIGAIDSSARWPLNHIDWEAAANDLKQDYQEVEFGDHTYLIRNY